MADKATDQTLSMEAAEEEFGLEPNTAEPDEAAEPEDAGDLETAVQGEIEDYDLEDNLEVLNRRRAREAEAEAEAPEGEDSGSEEELEAEGEGGDEDEDDGEKEEDAESEEDGEQEGEEEREEEPDDDADDVTRAQRVFDALVEKFGDQLTAKYRANGEELTESVAKLRNHAAGYSGAMRELTETRQALDQARQEAARTEGLKQQNEYLIGALNDPQRLVSEVLLQHADEDYLRTVHDALGAAVLEIEANPQSFRFNRTINERFNGLEQAIQQIAGQFAQDPGSAGAGRPGSADPSRQGRGNESGEEAGFIPGKGYPDAVVGAVETALREAVEGLDLSFEEVVDAWEAEGKKEPVFTTLKRLVRKPYPEPEKLGSSRNPPVRRVKKRRSTSTERRATPPRSKKRSPSTWDGIEKEVARDIRALQESGAL